ncbi:unnamed protein product [Lathyrus sativus]|nr:unnamed protein product [Lathyrus sativus]
MRPLRNDEDWVKLMGKKRRYLNKLSIWNARQGKDNGMGERILSFFFTEFPDDYEAEEMAEIFKDYGLISEVFIPAKRDKRERRYGFVRFWKVSEDKPLAAKLDSIPIEWKKIYTNILRFKRFYANGISKANSDKRKMDGGNFHGNRRNSGIVNIDFMDRLFA